MPIPLHLVVLHDDSSEAELFVHELTGAGFEPDWKRVETESDFLTALGPLIDLVLANYALPKYDGLTALRTMRDRGLDIPLIIVSGSIGEELAAAAVRDGAADYLLKDQLSRLGPAVSQALERREEQRKRNAAAAALRESERRLKDAQALGRVGSWEYDFEGHIIDWSDQMYALYERDPALGPPTVEEEAAYYSPEHRQMQREYARRALEEGTGFEYELEVNLPSGNRRHFFTVTRPIKDMQGQIVKLFGTVQDTTERNRAEQRLRESEERFRATFEQAAVGIAHAAPGGGWLRVNQKLCDIVGYTREELVEKSVRITHPADLDKDLEGRRQLLEDKVRSYSVEKRYLRKDGSIVWVKITLSLVRTASGEPDYFISVIEDISVRKQAEATLELQGAALNAAADAIFIADRNGAIEWVNPAFTALTGYASEEALGKNPGELLDSGVHDQAFYKDLWDTILAGAVWQGEITNRRKDGHLYYEEQIITPVKDALGEVAHFIAIKRDMTERKQLAAEFLQAQKMESVGQLAAGIAHDFNNLLNVINGMAYIVSDQLKAGDPLRKDLGEITRAADRAAVMTRQLLAFSRKQIMQPKVLDLRSLVVDLEGMLRRLIGEDLDLVVLPSRDSCTIKADPGQIEQVIMNLAVNARDAMPTGGTLAITTEAVELDDAFTGALPPMQAGPYVLLTVSDTGAGMDETTRKRIFEPFFTTKEVGKGTGLGLSTVFGIVSQSGGGIEVVSKANAGTTFKVFLPRIVEVAAADRPAQTLPPERGVETILVVEDYSPLLQLARRMLERAGYTVLVARSGREALQLLDTREGPVDLLLTDVVMPEVSGRELAGRVAEAHPEIKVIYTSGYINDAVMRHGVRAEAVHFLAKPYTYEALTHAVRTVLDSPAEKPQ